MRENPIENVVVRVVPGESCRARDGSPGVVSVEILPNDSQCNFRAAFVSAFLYAYGVDEADYRPFGFDNIGYVAVVGEDVVFLDIMKKHTQLAYSVGAGGDFLRLAIFKFLL